jgi:hypothetical protein
MSDIASQSKDRYNMCPQKIVAKLDAGRVGVRPDMTGEEEDEKMRDEKRARRLEKGSSETVAEKRKKNTQVSRWRREYRLLVPHDALLNEQCQS